MRFLPCAAVLALAALPAVRAETPFDYKGLGDTVWTANEWGGATPKPSRVPQIAFAPPSGFTASAGCNRHMGTYTVTAERIAFHPKGSTKMACHGELRETDARLLADLRRIARLTLAADGTLTAHAEDDTILMRLRCTKNC